MEARGRLTAGAVILGLALPVAAVAQQATLPQPQTEGNVTYLSGGIGQDEALAMKEAQKQYPLSMIFTQGGEYLANVPVDIRDKSGKTVLHAVSNGPIMLVKLPAGEYRVSAQMNGKTLQHTAKVRAAGNTHLSFNWPLV